MPDPPRTPTIAPTPRKLPLDAHAEGEIAAALELLAHAEEVFWTVDEASGRVLYVSPAYARIWGREPDSLIADPVSFLEHVHPEDRDLVHVGIGRPLSGHRETDYRIVRPDGEVRWIRTRGYQVRDEEGAIVRTIGISQDVTESRESEEILRRVALHDPLTDLPNRTAFMNRLRRAVVRAQRVLSHRFAVLFVDLDRFKVINDSLGHGIGDELLAAVARRLETCVRPEDLVARLAGDEFIMLLHQISEASDAARVAERVIATLAEPFDVSGYEVFTGGSVGIALSDGATSADAVVRDADIAMYRAKSTGKGRYEMYDAAMHAAAVARLELEMDLRAAAESGAFSLYYQPIVSLSEGRITGFEALVRWRHPQRGLVQPDEFIRVAEETGLIVPIGRWVLMEACRQMKEWSERFAGVETLTISVNLSGRQFAQRDIIDHIQEALTTTGLSADHLKLEITESVIIDNNEAVSSLFKQLKGLGLQLQMDDFGTGYSSLSYLDRFPINTLKIDSSFVQRIDTPGASAEIVRTMVQLGHNLSMEVVAEGVETEMQLRYLRGVGCEFAQGYFFSVPLDHEAAEKLLESAPRW